MDKKLVGLIDKAVSRRSFLAASGATAAATVMVGCGGSNPTTTPTPTTTPSPTVLTDVDYLNFALNLEYLEAEYYLRAATGTGLSADDAGGSSTVVITPTTTQIPNLTPAQQNYILEIAQNELDHVRFLRSALGAEAVERPVIDLRDSWNGLASAAGIGSSFNPFVSYEAFLIGAFTFEDVGVTAYHGAAGLLTNKQYLAAAASIMAVEAYHAGEIRALLIADSVANATVTATSVTPNNTYIGYANQVSALRASLGGGNETSLTPLPAYSLPFVPTAYTPASSIVAADPTTSVAYARTTDQVLHIVYAAAPGAGVFQGGFYPNGMNGNIKVTNS